MSNWFQKLWGSTPPSNPPSIHPPWQTGQCVTYFLQYDDGGWVAFALRVLGQANDGAWILSGDFKTPLGEGTTWFRCDPNAPRGAPDVVPVREETIRMSPIDANDPRRFTQDPSMMSSLAMNLLLVRRSPAALESLQGPARAVAYPCGIDHAYSLISPGPGYQKHHDLNPRVLITGVACLSIDGDQNPMTVTSFGFTDPNAHVTAYEDFVDLSHPTHIVHDGFTLTYPATWFLRPRSQEVEAGVQDYFLQVGGISCIATLSVCLERGSRDQIAQKREALLSLHSNLKEGAMGRLSPRRGVRFQLEGNAQGFVSDLDNPGIAGFAYSGVYCADTEDRLAHVNVFGCASRQNPRLTTTLTEMESGFRAILESFRFI
ncbi:MAG: hypothetical protein JWL77_2568 [Chthonomonadaceae bacterium]|nr:hypothetical protein [Chthonomonadaceae bacterium]